jgi:hypothetical protein
MATHWHCLATCLTRPAPAPPLTTPPRFVTYKWPSWLHKQTEKQRIIWAYKILFLDVLFPLGLKKVIFCDSDQVVRADLRELWHMDLQGAPYGYTPFCDNNQDMEGFRFWKTVRGGRHLALMPPYSFPAAPPASCSMLWPPIHGPALPTCRVPRRASGRTTCRAGRTTFPRCT